MTKPTEFLTCYVHKNMEEEVEVSTPEGTVTAQRGDYIVTDAEGNSWVFAEAEWKRSIRNRSSRSSIRSALAAQPALAHFSGHTFSVNPDAPSVISAGLR